MMNTENVNVVGAEFVLAGKAIFTVVGAKSRFTYRVTKKEFGQGQDARVFYFASVLTGNNNETDYSYIGKLDPKTGIITATKGTKVSMDAPSVVALQWTLKRLFANVSIEPAILHHEGKCGRCGRTLTVPESITSGIGPECAKIRAAAAIAA